MKNWDCRKRGKDRDKDSKVRGKADKDQVDKDRAADKAVTGLYPVPTLGNRVRLPQAVAAADAVQAISHATEQVVTQIRAYRELHRNR